MLLCHIYIYIYMNILIGADYMWPFMESQTKRGEFDEPVAVLTKLGWVISGPMKMECKEKLSSINFVTTHVLKVSQLQDYHMEDNLSTQLEKFWSLDSIGIQEKDTAHEAFLKNIEFKDERYSVKLPFKEHHDILPDNYENAALRLKSNLKRLNNQPEVLQEYDSIIQEQLKAGFCNSYSTNKKMKSTINFTFNYSKQEVIFLDTKTSFQHNVLVSQLYSKPTSAHQYLQRNSFHPPSLLKSIPKSQFIRIRRICTHLSDYWLHATKFLEHFSARGFNRVKLQQ